MKKIFINITSKREVKIPNTKKALGIVTTSQYIEQAKETHKKIKNSIYVGQVVGCNVSKASKIKNKVDAFLFIGEGRFHALEIARQTGKEVFIASGDKITKEEIKKYKARKKAKLTKFYAANIIGILVSTKPGQKRLKEAVALKKKLKKKSYIFIDDTFDINSLENFPGIDIFINTACPRIEGKNIIPLTDLEKSI